jgi:hypothetical protein
MTSTVIPAVSSVGPAARRSTPHGGFRRRPFYIGVTLLMGLIAVVGFWPTYFGPLVLGTIRQPLLIHLHATIFTGWLLLFLTQVLLAATGRVAWHLRLGRIGIGYGVVVVIVGLLTAINRSADRVRAGAAGGRLLFVSVADMAVFSIFFVAAIVLRRKPQVHKRLMLVAATALLVAAASRMTFLPFVLRQAIWVSPILLAMVYDFRVQRTVHRVYLLGLVALLVRAVSPQFIVDTDAWSAVTHWVLTFVT